MVFALASSRRLQCREKKIKKNNGRASKFERENFIAFMAEHGLLEFERLGPCSTFGFFGSDHRA